MDIVPNSIYQGDCMELLPRIATDSVDLVLADPPYGIDYQSGYRALRYRKILNDQMPYIWWLQEAQRVLKPTGSLICFVRWDVMDIFARAMQYCGLSIQSCIVWDKQSHGAGDTRRMFGPRHEMALFGIKSKEFAFPGRRPVDVLRYTKINGTQLLHPAQKPTEMLKELIEVLTVPGALVVDPFLGCGSSAVACVQTGRQYIGMELDSTYYDIAIQRLAAMH